LPELIDGIMAGHIPTQSIAVASTPLVQSAGGGLLKLPDGYFYLVMGHSFQGSYTTFEGLGEHNHDMASQTYLNEIRKLKIGLSEGGLKVSLVDKFTDETEFHRRDLNVAHILSPQGLGIAMFGGVFTPETQLNYSKPIYLSAGARPLVDSGFEQKLSSYSCAKLLLYDRGIGAMYTTFFGGISRYSWNADTGQFIENPKVGDKVSPVYRDGLQWSDQISTIESVSDGAKTVTSELANPSSLPAYTGADAVFVPSPAVARAYPDTDILDLGSLTDRKTFVGYIYGGIRAFPNRFPYNKTAEPYNSGAVPTKASDLILKVYVQSVHVK